jgi:hypothetical protein
MKTKKADLFRKMAMLESVNDQLASELSYVDQLMRLVGFTGGIETLKATAKELIDMDLRQEKDEEQNEF